jgi:homogentisate 1,2-dioxygenase
MKVIYKPTNQWEFEIDARDGMKTVFEQVGNIQEVLGATSKCGKCGHTVTRLVHRKVDGNDFYESICQKCFAKLSFGTNQEERTLFPRRYAQDENDPKKKKINADGDVVYLPSGGWLRYNKETGKNE